MDSRAEAHLLSLSLVLSTWLSMQRPRKAARCALRGHTGHISGRNAVHPCSAAQRRPHAQHALPTMPGHQMLMWLRGRATRHDPHAAAGEHWSSGISSAVSQHGIGRCPDNNRCRAAEGPCPAACCIPERAPKVQLQRGARTSRRAGSARRSACSGRRGTSCCAQASAHTAGQGLPYPHSTPLMPCGWQPWDTWVPYAHECLAVRMEHGARTQGRLDSMHLLRRCCTCSCASNMQPLGHARQPWTAYSLSGPCAPRGGAAQQRAAAGRIG